MKGSTRKNRKFMKAVSRFVTPLPPEDIGRCYTKSELTDDLEFMLQTMEEVHPNLFFHLSREDMKPLVEDVKRKLLDGQNRIEFFALIASLTTRFYDGHTQVFPPNEEYRKHVHGGGLIFPFDVNCSSGKIKVVRSYSEKNQLLEGAFITSINEHSDEDLLDSMISLLSSESRDTSLKRLSISFRKMLFLLLGSSDTFNVTLNINGKLEKIELQGVTSEKISQEKEQNSETDEIPYRFEIHKREGYTILDFRSFVDLDRFKSFLRNMFEEIKSTGVKNLIIDLRKNEGGNSLLTDELCSYLTDKPFRQFSRMDLKISHRIRRYYSVMMRYLSPFPLNILPARILFFSPWSKPVGGVASTEIKAKKSKTNKLRFSGKVIALTGAYTYSSATGLAAVLKDHDLGKIVGAPTGGFASSYGDSYLFSLPNTRLQCSVSHKLFIRPDGDEAQEPVQPDYPIDAGDSDTGIDRVLEFAIRLTAGNIPLSDSREC